jgi:hypothetical protein
MAAAGRRSGEPHGQQTLSVPIDAVGGLPRKTKHCFKLYGVCRITPNANASWRLFSLPFKEDYSTPTDGSTTIHRQNHRWARAGRTMAIMKVTTASVQQIMSKTDYFLARASNGWTPTVLAVQ